jgi:hypothetical protein
MVQYGLLKSLHSALLCADGIWYSIRVTMTMINGLFITNYAVLRGGSGPAVMKIDVGVPGLPLP